jgi:aarF domain-containing kinase
MRTLDPGRVNSLSCRLSGRMLKWPRAIPSSRRLAFSLVPPTRLSPVRHVSYRLFPHPRLKFFRKPVFWLLPVAGGISLYFYPRPQPILSQFFSSPTLIPCPPYESPTSPETLILSPSEHDHSPSERICTLFVEHIWEPILTARRFVHLFFLLFPVILSSPMLLVGSPDERLQGDRWGAVWWYDYLVAQMDRAGPTFIKVRNIVLLFVI